MHNVLWFVSKKEMWFVDRYCTVYFKAIQSQILGVLIKFFYWFLLLFKTLWLSIHFYHLFLFRIAKTKCEIAQWKWKIHKERGKSVWMNFTFDIIHKFIRWNFKRNWFYTFHLRSVSLSAAECACVYLAVKKTKTLKIKRNVVKTVNTLCVAMNECSLCVHICCQ